MLKTILVSLLAGCLALLAGLYLTYDAPATSASGAPLAVDFQAARALAGSGTQRQGAFQLQLDESGRGVLLLPTPGLQLDQYSHVNILLQESFSGSSLELMWKAGRGGNISRTTVPHRGEKSLWIATDGLPGWEGEAVSMVLSFQGEAEQSVLVRAVALAPPSFSMHLTALFRDWSAFGAWKGTSINLHSGGQTAFPPVPPVPVAAAMFALSALAYGLLLSLPRSGMRFDSRIIPALFIVCWISLDLLWQRNLLLQLNETRQQFAGKDTPARLASGPNASLYRFIEEVRQHIPSADARVFASSFNEGQGMRGAYYLYPLNAFWQRGGEELPQRQYLRRGDYLVLLQPSTLSFDPGNGVLFLPDNSRIEVDLLLHRPQGKLLRVL